MGDAAGPEEPGRGAARIPVRRDLALNGQPEALRGCEHLGNAGLLGIVVDDEFRRRLTSRLPSCSQVNKKPGPGIPEPGSLGSSLVAPHFRPLEPEGACPESGLHLPAHRDARPPAFRSLRQPSALAPRDRGLASGGATWDISIHGTSQTTGPWLPPLGQLPELRHLCLK